MSSDSEGRIVDINYPIRIVGVINQECPQEGGSEWDTSGGPP